METPEKKASALRAANIHLEQSVNGQQFPPGTPDAYISQILLCPENGIHVRSSRSSVFGDIAMKAKRAAEILEFFGNDQPGITLRLLALGYGQLAQQEVQKSLISSKELIPA